MMGIKDAAVLVIDDDQDVLMALRLLLKPMVKEVVTEQNPNNIIHRMGKTNFDVIILDMNFNTMVNTGNEGIYWLNQIKAKDPDMAVILVTAYAEIDIAIRGLKEGATDFLVKPWQNDKIIDTIRSIVNAKSKRNTIKTAPKEQDIVGDSEVMSDVFLKIRKLGPTDANVLILGENGTGKDLIARAIHNESNRKHQPFIKVDVGTLTASLFESELFGYKKGAFTDAREDREGRFEAANGGTIFWMK
jgi:two-component system response regulator HydG